MRYRVLDLPPRGAGAFMPTPSTNAPASSAGLQHVHGSPGTDPVPAPSPQSQYLPTLTANGGVDAAQGSMVAPDLIAPSVYVAEVDNMGPEHGGAALGMRVRRLNPLPMPAFSYPRTPVAAFATPRYGGRATMAWPRAFQRFPITSCPPVPR